MLQITLLALAAFILTHRRDTPAITVSGLAGAGSLSTIQQTEGPGNLIVIGDKKSEATPENGTLSSRVMYAASMQAHTAIQILSQ